MLQDMAITFDTTNEEIELHRKLREPASHQRPDEPFPDFAARVNGIMAGAQISEGTKCMHLQSLMQPRLRRETYAVTDYSNYRKYCSEVTRVWQNMAYHSVDMDNSRTTKQESSKYKSKRYQPANPEFARTPRKKSSSASKAVWDISRFKRHPAAKKKLMEQGACSKCLVIGHHSTDADAPCKDKPAIPIDEAVSKLAIMDIVWDPATDNINDSSDEYDSESQSEAEN